MARKLTSEELYDLIAKRCKVPHEEAKSMWLALNDIMVEELMNYGEIRLPYFATLKTKYIKEKNMLVPDSTQKGAGRHLTYVPPHLGVRVVMSVPFVERVNGEKLTKGEVGNIRAKARKEMIRAKEEERQKEIFKRKSAELSHLRERKLVRKKHSQEYFKKRKEETKK
jgi:nucleoid DNA-binding protein